MDNLVNIINNEYQKIFDNNGEHLFFNSYDWAKPTFDKWYYSSLNVDIKQKRKYQYDPNIDIEKIDTQSKCKYIPKEKLPDKLVDKLYKLFENPNSDFKEINKELGKMYNYYIPSTIKNLPEYLDKIKKDNKENNTIGIIICGAGPIGLYLALYLYNYYCISGYSLYYKKLNIIIIENRISEENRKTNYSRQTQFNFDVRKLTDFRLLKNYFCWKNNNLHKFRVRSFDFINNLENLLYLTIRKTPIELLFTKKYETFKEVKKLALEYNFKYIFDCTGGRLETDFNKTKLKWNKFKMKRSKPNETLEVKLIDNKYKLYRNGELYKQMFIVLQLLDKNKKEFRIGNVFAQARDKSDEELVLKYNNRCFKTEDYIKFSKAFKYKYIRYLLPHIINLSNLKLSEIKYINLTYFYANSFHKPQCAYLISKKKEVVYIALGDTLGSSEYGIYFGLDSSMNFIKHITPLVNIY